MCTVFFRLRQLFPETHIDDVQQALQARGYWLNRSTKRIGGGGRSGPLRVTTKDGYVIWVGRNSRQNEQVTFKNASGQDYWLHARDVPGSLDLPDIFSAGDVYGHLTITASGAVMGGDGGGLLDNYLRYPATIEADDHVRAGHGDIP